MSVALRESRPFMALLGQPEDFEKVMAGFEHAMKESFKIQRERYGRRNPITQWDIKERAKLCEKWFRIFRGERGMTTQQSLDFLTAGLMHELDGDPLPTQTPGHGWGIPRIKVS